MNKIIRVAVVAALHLPCFCLAASAQELAPLPKPTSMASDALIDLGKTLFFDGRLSGDATTSCATCHDPTKAFTDGLELSAGYPGTKYFRNTPTLINASLQRYFYWDARMSGDDLPSLVRDHIAEAHFMQADGRLVIERLRQIPQYEAGFKNILGGEPSYGKILNAVAAYVRSLRSQNAPIDRYLGGDKSALSESATRGLTLFKGKANCIACHHGPMLSDGKIHATGVPQSEDVFADPERHITFRRFMRTLGVGQCATLRQDIGHGCVTKSDVDSATFRTPSLREVSRTAPYMHNGQFPDLASVVAFYNAGGGDSENKSEILKPLDLNADEQSDLVKFLEALSGDPIETEPPTLPPYELRQLGQF
ncbi:MAG: cytochrome c peroxidase [Pirellulaceae bacterium]